MKPIDLNSLIGVLSIFSPLTQSSPGGVGDAFSANKSTRPYTTFELDQIRQHAKRYVIDIIFKSRSMYLLSIGNSKYVLKDVLRPSRENFKYLYWIAVMTFCYNIRGFKRLTNVAYFNNTDIKISKSSYKVECFFVFLKKNMM